MIVDMLLKLLGENPAGYPTFSDKMAGITAALLGYSTIYLSYVLVILPWAWLLWQKKKKREITKKMIIIVIIVSAILFWLGYNLPWWIIEIMGGITVRGIYGGQI
ncbi:MAG: DNA translocase FtsK 4TM domain-containing protein [bacterium]|nr:DNA translocase FtsK 4TM domain-containing protein [bacterium]